VLGFVLSLGLPRVLVPPNVQDRTVVSV